MRARSYAPLLTLLTAAFLFRMGNAAARLALPWLALLHTGSAAWAGTMAAASVLATIVGAWLGGGLVDRCGHAPVALISGLVGGAATAVIPLLHALGELSNGALLACVILGAAFDAPGMAAQDSHLPALGRRAGLSVERVSSLKAVMSHVAFLGGPVVGGAAVGLLGAAATLWLTAGASLVAGLLAVRVLPRRAEQAPPSAAEQAFRVGAVFLWRDPLLRPLLALVLLFTGVASANASVVIPSLFLDAGRSAAELGLFSSAMGAGGLVGIALHAALGAKQPPQRWLALAFASYGAASIILALLPGVAWLLLLGGLVGALTGPVSPILNATIYHRTPPWLLGRVLGAVAAVMLSAAPAVTVAAGALVDLAGAGMGLVVLAALASGVALPTLFLRFQAGAASDFSVGDASVHGQR